MHNDTQNKHGLLYILVTHELCLHRSLQTQMSVLRVVVPVRRMQSALILREALSVSVYLGSKRDLKQLASVSVQCWCSNLHQLVCSVGVLFSASVSVQCWCSI